MSDFFNFFPQAFCRMDFSVSYLSSKDTDSRSLTSGSLKGISYFKGNFHGNLKTQKLAKVPSLNKN